MYGDAHTLARLDQVANVGERGFIFADECDDEPGMNSPVTKRSTASEQFGAQISCNRASV